MCTVSALNEITARVVQAARDSLGDKLHKVILYGSYARGDHDDESDIDVLILADIPLEEASTVRRKIRERTGDLDLEYDVVLSMYVTSAEKFYEFLDVLPFCRNVLKDGVVLCTSKRCSGRHAATSVRRTSVPAKR